MTTQLQFIPVLWCNCAITSEGAKVRNDMIGWCGHVTNVAIIDTSKDSTISRFCVVITYSCLPHQFLILQNSTFPTYYYQHSIKYLNSVCSLQWSILVPKEEALSHCLWVEWINTTEVAILKVNVVSLRSSLETKLTNYTMEILSVLITT